MSDAYLFNPLTSTAFTTTATSFTNVSGLSQAVVAGALYRVQAFGNWQMSVQTTTTALITVAGVAATMAALRTSMQTAAAGATSTELFRDPTFATTPTLITPGVIATPYGWLVDGLIIPSANGTLSVQARCGGTAGGTLTIATGSRLIVEQLT